MGSRKIEWMVEWIIVAKTKYSKYDWKIGREIEGQHYEVMLNASNQSTVIFSQSG